jgi:hypothetical protein
MSKDREKDSDRKKKDDAVQLDDVGRIEIPRSEPRSYICLAVDRNTTSDADGYTRGKAKSKAHGIIA